MRKILASAAVIMALGLLVPVDAQTFTPQTILSGVSPRQITFQKVDTSRAIQPGFNIGQSFRPPKPPTTFSLSSVFPRITLAPWPPKLPNFFGKKNLTPNPVQPQRAMVQPGR